MAQWQRLTGKTSKDEPSHILDRIEIPEGWLYRTTEIGFSGTYAVAMTFVPHSDTSSKKSK